MAQDTGPNYDTDESITVAGTAVSLTAATYGERPFALITVETAAIRFRFGTAPTATVGHVLEPGDVLTLLGHDQLKSIQFIRRDGTSATIFVSYGW